MTIPVSHRLATMPGDRYACNCGADSQNERAAMLDRVEASDAAVHSHRVDDGSLETAATTERTFPRVSLSTVVPGSLIEIASGEIGIVLKPNRETATGLRSIAWVRRWNGLVSELSAGATVSLRATPTELDALTSADGASRPTLTEEQAAAWAREMAETNEPGWEPNAAALLRAARGELGPTKPGAQ